MSLENIIPQENTKFQAGVLDPSEAFDLHMRNFELTTFMEAQESGEKIVQCASCVHRHPDAFKIAFDQLLTTHQVMTS